MSLDIELIKEKHLKGLKEYDYVVSDSSLITKKSYEPKVKLPDIFKNAPKAHPDAQLIPNFPIYTATVMGHVDNGKSTLLGRLLQLCGRVKSHIIESYKEEAKKNQKATFEYAWVLDTTKTEREKGVTIDLSFKEFNTANRYFTMIDSPGHKDYLKNSIIGIMQADVAILALDMKKGLDLNINAKEHILAARASGVNSIIVALTKVDTIPLEDRAEVYITRVTELRDYLTNVLSWPPHRITIVPVNSLKDPSWNIVENTPEELPFYNGPTLVQALDEIEIDPVRSDLPLRIAVEDVLTAVPGTNVVVTGKVLSGTVNANDKVIINPGNHPAEVRMVTMHHQEIKSGLTNCNVGVDIINVDKKTAKKNILRGSILADAKNPAKTVKEIICDRVLFLNHPTALSVGSKVIGHYLTGHVSLLIKSIENVYNLAVYKGDYRETGAKETPGYTHGQVKTIKPNTVARITFIPEKPIVVEPIQVNPKMGNLLLRDFGTTLAISKITEVVTAFN